MITIPAGRRMRVRPNAEAPGEFKGAIDSVPNQWIQGQSPEIDSVSGIFAVGQELTISVNNLSTKRSGQLHYENFEGLAVGQDPGELNAAIGTDGLYAGSDDRPIFGSVFPRDNAVQRNLDKLWVELGAEYRTELYAEVWLRVLKTDFDDPAGAQIKYPRLTPALDNTGNAQGTNPILGATDNAANGSIGLTKRPDSIDGEPALNYYFPRPPEDTWFKLVYYIRLNDEGVKNGERYLKGSYFDSATNSQLDGTGQHYASPTGVVAPTEWKGEPIEFDLASMTDGAGFRSFIATPYYQRDGQSTVIDAARQFINDSPERVMVGDAPTWAACDQSKTFVLPTTSRDNGVVVANVDDLGPLAGSAAYLYVFNSDGLCNEAGSLVATSPTLANGQILTITGSGFEPVSNPLPHTHDNFDYSGLAAGEEVPYGTAAGAIWGSEYTTSPSGYILDDAVKMPGRRVSAKSLTNRENLKRPYQGEGGPDGSPTTIYISGWIRFNESTDTPPQPGLSSNKILRVWDSASGTRTAWQATEHPWLYVDHTGTFETLSEYPSREVFEDFPGEWHRFEHYHSTDGDGPIKLWLDGKLVLNITGAFKAPGIDQALPFYTGLIGYDVSQSSAVTETLRHWLGDFHDQPTFARIELSNYPVIDDSGYQKKKYVQLCTERTETSITLSDLYLADLDLEQPLYMHEYKSDGSVSTTELIVGDNVQIVSSSGALATGQRVSVSGSGFGALASPEPSAFDDMTSYGEMTEGDPVPNGIAGDPGARWENGSLEPLIFSDTIAMPGRSLSVTSAAPRGNLQDPYMNPSGMPLEITRHYCSGWIRLSESAYDGHPDLAVSFKFMRLWGGTSGLGHMRSSHLFRNGTPVDGPMFSGGGEFFVYHAYPFPPQEWIRYECEVFDAVYDEVSGWYDAKMRIFINGKAILLQNSGQGFEGYDKPIKLTPQDGDGFKELRMRLFGSDPSIPDNLSQSFRTNLAEIHLQASPARVELSNEAVFDTTVEQKRFYQVCESRSDDEIIIPSLYLGDLDRNSPIYMHVIREDHSVVTVELVLNQNVEIL